MKAYITKIIDISEEKLNRISLLIDSDKKTKIDKYHNKKDKIRSLIGDILIRNIIIKELNIQNNYITFDKNKYGKPYLLNYPKFNFNISHSEEYVACAVDDKPIGIDIEKIKIIKYEEITERFFTEEELKYILREDLENDKQSKFYEIWTLKESFIKCCGKGLSIPLKSFSINVDKYKNISVNDKQNKYKLKSFNIDEDYKMAVCSNNQITKEIITIDTTSLINNCLTWTL